MKKFLFMFITALVICANPILAQQKKIEATTALDNWFVGANVGAVAPQNHAFNDFDTYRFELGLEVGKWLTPVIGGSFSDELTVNTTPSHTAFDENDLMGNLHVNLTNLFLGYDGNPRFFETRLITSLGWKHYYSSPDRKFALREWLDYFHGINTMDVRVAHINYVVYRTALSFDFNLSDAWQLNVTPGLSYFNRFRAHTGRFDVRAGLTYKIKGGNSHSHNFVVNEYYTKGEYDDLSNRFNKVNGENKELKKTLKECRESQTKVVEEKIVKVYDTDDIIIGFNVNSTDLSPYATVLKKVADKIKLTKKNIVITGYASLEGSDRVNSILADQRGDFVAYELMSQYGVPEDKITVINGGTTSQFGNDNKFNRVAVIHFE